MKLLDGGILDKKGRGVGGEQGRGGERWIRDRFKKKKKKSALKVHYVVLGKKF